MLTVSDQIEITEIGGLSKNLTLFIIYKNNDANNFRGPSKL